MTTETAIRGDALTDQQQMFCHEYAKDFHQKDAAIRAGFSAKSADSQASQLLKMPKVRAYLAKLQAPRLEKAGVAADRTLAELVAIGFSDIAGMYEEGTNELKSVHEMSPAVRAAIQSIEVSESGMGDGERVTKIKLWNKIEALTAIAKHLGLLKQDININITDSSDLREVPTSELLEIVKRAKAKRLPSPVGPPAAP